MVHANEMYGSFYGCSSCRRLAVPLGHPLFGL
jgi:hypothetical protein